MIRIFIGYDPREAVAYHVLCHSIIARAQVPVSITPLALNTVCTIHDRPRDPLQSTDFAFTRFLVPYLCGYKGWAIFMDCDMLCLTPIERLFALRDSSYAVMCVKHRHEPNETVKFLGQKQTNYGMKNWSSVMLFNNARCRALDPEDVNTTPGLDLHQFKWLGDDSEIGALPPEWNHLVGYDKWAYPRLLHYTQGGPWFADYRRNDQSTALWMQEYAWAARCEKSRDLG